MVDLRNKERWRWVREEGSKVGEVGRSLFCPLWARIRTVIFLPLGNVMPFLGIGNLVGRIVQWEMGT